MNKNPNYKELAHSIALRSPCKIKVGCILYDSHGIFAWGWNHSGNGYGMCAERHAISRANKRRLKRSHCVVIAIRRGRIICSYPCPKCMAVLQAAKVKFVTCTNQDKIWQTYRI